MIFEIKNLLKNSSFIWKVRCFFSLRVLGNNKINVKGKGNSLVIDAAFIKKTKIIVIGCNNIIKIGSNSRFEGFITIYGDNNFIEILQDFNIKGAKFWIEDDCNEINIGRYTTIENNTELASIEGCKIYIEEDCMLSSDITLRTGDSHSIIDNEGNRINPSKDIIIGTHVWIGNKAVIAKGARISNNSIIGSGSLVTKVFDQPNCILAGIPAKIIKEQISWKRERIKI